MKIMIPIIINATVAPVDTLFVVIISSNAKSVKWVLFTMNKYGWTLSLNTATNPSKNNYY